MNNLPKISNATISAQASQFSRLKGQELLDNLRQNMAALKLSNPEFADIVGRLSLDLFSEEQIDSLNRASKTPEEFSERIQIGVLAINHILIKMIDSQIEANNMKDMFQ